MQLDDMLDKRKVQLIQMRIQGKNKSEIAREIGVSRQTIYTWLQDSDVIQAIEDVKKDLVQAAEMRLIYKLDKYIDEMDTLAIKSADARTKNSALQYLIDRAMGKVAQKIEATEVNKDSVTDDVLSQAIADVDGGNSGNSNNDDDA
jgi:transposase-like protein